MVREGQKPFCSHRRENICSPADEVREESGSDVPGGVDGVAAVGAHRDPNNKHGCSHQHGLKSVREGGVPLVPESQDTQQQRSCADHLVTRQAKHGITPDLSVMHIYERGEEKIKKKKKQLPDLRFLPTH